MIHELKCWPTYFAAVLDGSKPFEVRERRDRDFKVGDELWLREWDQMSFKYSGRECHRTVTYVLDAAPFAPPGYCVMGLSTTRSAGTRITDERIEEIASSVRNPNRAQVIKMLGLVAKEAGCARSASERTDAARYRWLRHDTKDVRIEKRKAEIMEVYQGPALDEQIDKMMAKENATDATSDSRVNPK